MFAGHSAATVSGNSVDKMVFFKLHRGASFRMYAGQSDMTNASHFTIRFCVDNNDGIIDGWLRDLGLAEDNRSGTAITLVVLKVREN